MNDINEKDWDSEVLQSPILVLADFWATWCGPCNSLAPVLSRIESSNSGKVKLVKMNIDENFEVPQKYQISALPTILFFKEGKVVKTMVGLQSESAIQKAIDELAST